MIPSLKLTLGTGLALTTVVSLNSPPIWMNRGRRLNPKSGDLSVFGNSTSFSSDDARL